MSKSYKSREGTVVWRQWDSIWIKEKYWIFIIWIFEYLYLDMTRFMCYQTTISADISLLARSHAHTSLAHFTWGSTTIIWYQTLETSSTIRNSLFDVLCHKSMVHENVKFITLLSELPSFSSLQDSKLVQCGKLLIVWPGEAQDNNDVYQSPTPPTLD